MQEIDYETKTEINSLIMERDILTKTIFRVYQQHSQLTKIQRDKLLIRYQHQLGVVVTQIEKLDNSMKRADVNPLDEGIFAAMDQKLSMMDEKLREISSQIKPSNKQTEKPKQKLAEVLSKMSKTKSMHSQNTTLYQSKSKPLEIITLTQIPSKIPEFFRRKLNPKEVKIEEIEPVTNQKIIKTTKKFAIQIKVTGSQIFVNILVVIIQNFRKKHCSKHTNSDCERIWLVDEETRCICLRFGSGKIRTRI